MTNPCLALYPKRLALSGLVGLLMRWTFFCCLYSQARTRNRNLRTSDCFFFQTSSKYLYAVMLFYRFCSCLRSRLYTFVPSWAESVGGRARLCVAWTCETIILTTTTENGGGGKGKTSKQKWIPPRPYAVALILVTHGPGSMAHYGKGR